MKVRTPQANEWIAVNPDPAYRREEMIIFADGDYYLVAENMVSEVKRHRPDLQTSMLFLAQNKDGELFLWPVKMPITNEHIVYQAMRSWVQYPVLN